LQWWFFFCTENDICSAGTCTGTAINVNDNILCTSDSCDEVNDRVLHSPDNTKCDDNVFCNGQETCSASGCTQGNSVDCSANNFQEINSCDYDSNPLTRDIAAGFTSVCDESNDACTQGTYDVTSNCDLTCGAQCVSDADVACNLEDTCIGNDYANYPVNGKCNSCLKNDSVEGACNPAIDIDSLNCRALVSSSLQVKQGVNFVSIPVILENKSIQDIFYGLENKITRVYGYQEGWKAYYFDKTELSSLQDIEEGEGYIIIAKEPFTMNLQGYTKNLNNNIIERPVFTLRQGWNLIGTFSGDMKVSEFLAGLDYNTESVFEYNNVYNKLNADSILKKDKAYWVYMNAEGVISPVSGGGGGGGSSG